MYDEEEKKRLEAKKRKTDFDWIGIATNMLVD
jgi:hypothetical protein